MAFFNDIVQTMMIPSLVVFTDLVPDGSMRSVLGDFLLYAILGCLAVNLSYVYLDIYTKVALKRKRLLHYRAIEMKHCEVRERLAENRFKYEV